LINHGFAFVKNEVPKIRIMLDLKRQKKTDGKLESSYILSHLVRLTQGFYFLHQHWLKYLFVGFNPSEFAKSNKTYSNIVSG